MSILNFFQSNAAIYRFAKKTYSVNFPMFAKVHVKGQDALDAYTFLIGKCVVKN